MHCTECPSNTFSYGNGTLGSCLPCPASRGVRCERGTIVPLDGFWSPAAYTRNASRFTSATELFECPLRHACLGNGAAAAAAAVAAAAAPRHARNGTAGARPELIPANAYTCAAGYSGVLCGVCSPGYLLKDGHCRRCADMGVSAGTKTAIALVTGALVVLAAFTAFARRHHTAILHHLHGMRRKYRAHRALLRFMRLRPAEVGVCKRYWTEEEKSAHSRVARALERVKASAARAAHRAVRNARNGAFGFGETFRIMLNGAKIITHLSVISSTFRRVLAIP